ncbi:MAG TPA: hypothetical protein VLW85_18740, partial [Myxococcales bacterium]|nr:hypothetical protein [Myxococcales bacterium]
NQSGGTDLDAARVDLLFAPAKGFSVNASYRYLGLQLPERDGPGNVGLGGASRRGDASASWEPFDGFIVSGHGGAEQDLTTSLRRAWAGPEVSLPRLFGGAGGFSAGWQEERGFDSGRTAWLQAAVTAPAWLRLTATGSWSYTKDGLSQADEFGLSLGAAARLSELVQLKLLVLSRLGGELGPLDGPLGGGAYGTAQVEGRF